MDNMKITNAKYQLDYNNNNTAISAIVDGEYLVIPMNAENNRHYAEILRQVEAGTLVIQEAD